MTIKLVKDLASPSLRKIERYLDTVPKAAFDFFKKTTPIDTGNARRNTRLQNTAIVAGYDYATELDKGSSTQARNGMVKPTTQHINRLIRQGVKK